MKKMKQNINIYNTSGGNNQPPKKSDNDYSKKPLGIALPALIGGIFTILSIIATYYFTSPSPKRASCNISEEIKNSIISIDKFGIPKTNDPDSLLVFEAHREQLLIYLKSSDLCENFEIKRKAKAEMNYIDNLINQK